MGMLRSYHSGRQDGFVWDVARPRRPCRMPGMAMAGFRDRGVAPKALRLIPHQDVTLVFDFGPEPPIVDDAAGRRFEGSLVAGLGFGGRVWARGTDLECVQVRLAPPIAGAVLGVRLDELRGGVVSLADLWGREADRVSQRLAEAGSWERRFGLVEELLLRRAGARARMEPAVALAWERITASRGTRRVEAIAAELGWSRKRLWSRFGSQIGLPPKRAASLVRFDHAAHLLAAGGAPARVAAASGYADQSHLHREVAAFTGATPAAVAREPFLAVDDVAWAGHLAQLPRRTARAGGAPD